MKNLFFLFMLMALFTSCSSDSPTSYAKKYCDCVEKHDGQHEDCAKIVSEAKKKFPEGKDEFKSVAGPCMNKP